MVKIDIDSQDFNLLQVHFDFSDYANGLIKQIDGHRWSRSRKCWVVPNTRLSVIHIGKHFGKEHCTFSEPVIRQYKPDVSKSDLWHYENRFRKRYWVNKPAMSEYDEREEIKALQREIKLRNYSYKTFKNYKSVFCSLIKFFKNKPLSELNTQDFKDYLYFLAEKRGLSGSSMNVHLNAIKFYLEKILEKPSVFIQLPEIKKEKKLPIILSVEEVRAIFAITRIEKFKIAFQLLYSTGLRLNELVKLKKSDIDFERLLIRVEQGKGKKDRYVMLSQKLKQSLIYYLSKHKNNIYVFQNEETGEPISDRTIQKIFSYALEFAKIEKKVGVHSLRHSFATHLLERGENIFTIKELLGHSDISTTLRYLHMSKEKINTTRSPIDDLL